MAVIHQISRNIFKVICIAVYALSITIKFHILTTTLSTYFRTTVHSFNISYSAVNSQKGLKTFLGGKFKILRFQQSSFPFMSQQYIHHYTKKKLQEKTHTSHASEYGVLNVTSVQPRPSTALYGHVKSIEGAEILKNCGY